MGKEIISQVQETQRVPDRINPRRNTPRHILTKLTKIKHKEQILNVAREKKQITHKGIPIRITADFFNRNLSGQKGMARHIQCDESGKSTTHITVSRKDLIQV